MSHIISPTGRKAPSSIDIAFFIVTLLFSTLSISSEAKKHGHGSETFKALEIDLAAGRTSHSEDFYYWDSHGSIGNDEHQWLFKSEGEFVESDFERLEIWGMYSKPIDEFWNAQAGIRYDFEPTAIGYLAFGIEGTAPFEIETEWHAFISHEGDLSTRIKLHLDLPLTQRIFTKPYLELDIQAQNVEEIEVGSGFSGIEFGIRTRYEITRKLAPFLDLRYERLLGQTKNDAEASVPGSEETSSFIVMIGLQLAF